jgi:hypothetical protein
MWKYNLIHYHNAVDGFSGTAVNRRIFFIKFSLKEMILHIVKDSNIKPNNIIVDNIFQISRKDYLFFNTLMNEDKNERR